MADTHDLERVVAAQDDRGTYEAYDTCTADQRAEQRCAPEGDVPAMVLTSSGVLAWSAEVTFHGSSAAPARQIRKLSPRGDERLSADPGIDVTSLAGAGRRIYWTESGRPVTATL